MKFYTFAEKQSNRLFHRYVENGKRHNEIVADYPLKLFIPCDDAKANSRSLYNQPLSSVEFSSPKDMADFINEYDGVLDIYGQTNPIYQFIAYEYPGKIEFRLEDYVIMNFDIEVEHSNGFPNPERAEQEIISITAKVFGKDFVTWGTKDYDGSANYVQCNSEKDLLIRFVSWWAQTEPDIVTGWNIEMFDIPYLINRLKNLSLDVDMLCPFRDRVRKTHMEKRIGQNDEQTYTILGVNIIDYLPLYKKYALEKLESYRLDFVGESEEVGNKVSLAKWGNSLMRLYNEDYNEFVRYNVQDVYLVEALDIKLQFMRLAITVTLMTKSRYPDFMGTVKPLDNLLYNMLLEENTQVPPERHKRDEEPIIGAYVKEPTPNYYEWLVSVDATSLYPSIGRMFNMSPETMVRGTVDDPMKRMFSILEGKFVPDLRPNQCTTANGAIFDLSKEGIIPKAWTMLFNERAKKKKEMNATKKEEAEYIKKHGDKVTPELTLLRNKIATLDAMQQALKILANGAYGAISNVHFRYHERSIAEGITVTGQLIIRLTEKIVNEYMNKLLGTTGHDFVIGIDTDSNYISLALFVKRVAKDGVAKDKIVTVIDKFIEESLGPYLAKELEKYMLALGVQNNLASMKRESICDQAAWRAKKNYILRVWDNEGVRYAKPKFKAAGIEVKRSSTPKFVRKALEDMLTLTFDRNESNVRESVREFKKKFMASDLPDIAFPKGVSEINKWLTSDGRLRSGTPIQSRAAATFNFWIAQDPELARKYEPIKEGGKIKYVYLREPNIIRSHVIGFVDELPPELNLHDDVDWDTQWKKIFLDPLKSFTDLLKWNIDTSVNSLEALFE